MLMEVRKSAATTVARAVTTQFTFHLHHSHMTDPINLDSSLAHWPGAGSLIESKLGNSPVSNPIKEGMLMVHHHVHLVHLNSPHEDPAN